MFPLVRPVRVRLRRVIVADVPEFPRDFAQVRVRGLNGEVDVVWATVVGSYFRIQAMPLRVDGISRHDIVEAFEVEPENRGGYGVVGSAGVFEFERVHTSSGNRTLTILFDSPLQESDPRRDLMDHLSRLNCDFGGYEHRHAVSVQPNQDIDQVCGYLDSCGFTWEWANPAGQVA